MDAATWVTLASGGPWAVIAYAFVRGWLVSRSVAERLAAAEKARADEVIALYKAASDAKDETIRARDKQVADLLGGFRALTSDRGDRAA